MNVPLYADVYVLTVGGCIAKLTNRRLQRAAVCSIVELQAAIKRSPAETNARSRPLRWLKDPAKIIVAVKRRPQSVGV
jgi:hypothetical protein